MKDIYQIILSNNHQMKKIRAIIDEIANNGIAVLIKGEIGTGKELLAEAIHLNSHHKHKPFVKFDSPAMQNGVLQIKLFEFVENPLTGIYPSKLGKFEATDWGTILLKNITETDISLQEKLLQTLQNVMFSCPRKEEKEKANPRIIATTTDLLEKSMLKRHLSYSLFSGVNFININVPPLRDRKEQIPLLLEYYLNYYKEKYGRDIPSFSSKLINHFKAYDWPGNIRELKNMVKGIVTNSEEDAILKTIPGRRSHVVEGFGFYENSFKNHSMEKNFFTLKDVKKQAVQNAEEDIIKNTLQQTHWNRKQATKLLGISYNALLYKIKKYDLK